MLKVRNNKGIVKGTARNYTKIFSQSIVFLLSPNLYSHIFFNGHVPHQLHPLGHKGIVHILPMNQKEILLYVGCVLPLFLGL